MIDFKHNSIETGSGQHAPIDVVHAALSAQFAPGCCVLSWNAAPYYVPGFQLSVRRDGRVIVRHVSADRRPHANRRIGSLAALERYQRTLIARGVLTELIDQRGKAPHLICCVNDTVMSTNGEYAEQ
jgi:hypothetical protein